MCAPMQHRLCFLGPIRVHDPNGILIGSAVFTGLTIVTDGPTNRPTDRPRYSVCNNKPHLRMMRPNKLNFSGDPDHRLDTGIVFRIRHYWEIWKVVSINCAARRCSARHAYSRHGQSNYDVIKSSALGGCMHCASASSCIF